jgi:murein DD-endopeptidase MepM/ murein hydrolase activator NlpD
LGSNYYAVRNGKVIWASDQRRSGGESLYGWHIIIDHGDGLTTLYAHAEPYPPVFVGQRVLAGDVIGFSGDTGNSTGPHLHFTVKKEGYILDGWPPGYMNPWPLLEHLYTR